MSDARVALTILLLLAAPGGIAPAASRASPSMVAVAVAKRALRADRTVGQHDAAPLLQGGQYRLGAGFWAEVEPGIFSDGFEGDPTALRMQALEVGD